MTGVTNGVITAVVVNWNGGDALLATLRSLLPLDVVVVDNASTDGSPERVAAELPEVRLIRNRSNRGLAAANNQGIAASSSPYVLICNPDVLVGPGTVDALRTTLERHPRAAWAIPRLVRPDGSLQTSVGDLPTLGDALLGRSWQRFTRDSEGSAFRQAEGGALRGCANWLLRSAHRRHARPVVSTNEPMAPPHIHQLACALRTGFWWDGWGHDEEVAVGHGMEACFLVRRAAIDDIGGQDERFPLDWEGIDWSERARRAGWEIWFCPEAEVVHLGGVTVRQVPFRWVARSHRGMYRYFATRSRPAVRPLLAAAFAARAGVKSAALATRVWGYR